MKKMRFLLMLPILLLAGCSNDPTNTTTPTEEKTTPKETTPEETTPEETTPPKTWKEIDEDGDVKITGHPQEIVIGATNSYQVDLSFSRNVTNSKAEFDVSDSSVLPLDTLAYHVQGDGSIHTGGYVSIDATKLEKAGTSFLEIDISSPNNASSGGTVCLELKVVETPNVTYWDETVLFEASSQFAEVKLEEGEKLIADFTDNDHVVGTDNPNRADEENKTYAFFRKDISALLEGEDSVSISFKYAVGHNIRLRTYVMDAEGKVVTWYYMLDTVGAGSTGTGFNEYDRETGKLTFVQENATLELTITDETYS